jgi:hypothetical protein
MKDLYNDIIMEVDFHKEIVLSHLKNSKGLRKNNFAELALELG